MTSHKPKDMVDILRHLATVQTSEPSKFKMSERNKKKWKAILQKGRELRGE